MPIAANPVHISRRLSAAPERVFAAFAESDLVGRWLTPSPDIPIEVLAYDFRVHGGYRFAYHIPNGQTLHVHGFFRDIVPPTQLIFSWIIEPPGEHAGIDSEVRVFIAAVPGGAILTILHERLDWRGALEQQTIGRNGAVDRVEFLLDARRWG